MKSTIAGDRYDRRDISRVNVLAVPLSYFSSQSDNPICTSVRGMEISMGVTLDILLPMQSGTGMNRMSTSNLIVYCELNILVIGTLWLFE